MERDDHIILCIILFCSTMTKVEATSTTSSSFQSRWIGPFLLMVVIGLFFLRSEQYQGQAYEASLSDQERKIPLAFCGKFCEARLRQRSTHHGGDWLSPKEMLELAKKARINMIQQLEQEYGSTYYQAIFLDGDKPRQVFVSANETNGKSLERFRRKLQFKVLEVQMALQQENESLEGCNCTTSANRRRLQQDDSTKKRQIVLPEVKPYYSKFVWATGGHSAAAVSFVCPLSCWLEKMSH
jgi:hypothetical protein